MILYELKKQLSSDESPFWLFFNEFSVRVLPSIWFFCFIYFLKPMELGVLSICNMTMALCYIFLSSGLRSVYLTDKIAQNYSNNNFFSVSVFLGFLCVIFANVISILVAKLFSYHQLTSLIFLNVWQILLMSLYLVQVFIFEQSKNYKNAFLIRLVVNGFSGIIALILLILNYDYVAVIYGIVFGNLLGCFFAWRVSSWRPRLNLDFKKNLQLFKAGLPSTFADLITWFYSWVDVWLVTFLYQFYVGGIFRFSQQLAAFLFLMLSGAFTVYIHNSIATSINAYEAVDAVFVKLARNFCLIIIPVFFLVFLNASLPEVFLSTEWSGIEKYLKFLTVAMLFSGINVFLGVFLRSYGGQRVEMWVLLIAMPLVSALYYLALLSSMDDFLWVRAFVPGLITLALLYYFSKVLAKPLLACLNEVLISIKPLILLLFTVGILILIADQLVINAIWVAVLSVISVAIYFYRVFMTNQFN